jgi:hypothetical protein
MSPDEPTSLPPTPDPSLAASRAMMQRLDTLEATNRKLRRQGTLMFVVTAVLLGLAVALVVTAARHGMPGFVPNVVEARQFLLRDNKGRIRGAWGSDEQGAIRLVLQDYRNHSSIKLNLLDDGSSGLSFTDSAGTARMVLAVLPDQTVNVVLGDSRGIARTVLGLNPNGGSTLLFADVGGTTKSGIGIDSRGRGMLSVANQEGAEPDSAGVERRP